MWRGEVGFSGRNGVAPDPAEFAKLVTNHLREAQDAEYFSFDASRLELVAADGDGPTIALANVYAEYCAARLNDRPTILRNFADAIRALARPLPASFEIARSDVFPAVRSRFFFESSKLRQLASGRSGPDLPYHPLNGYLGVGLVYDTSRSLRFLNGRDLQEWQVAFQDVLNAAAQNLRGLSSTAFGSARHGLYESMAGDSHDAARLVDFATIGKLPVVGELIAAVPSRDSLFITGARNQEGIASVTTFIEKRFNAPHAITGAVFRLVDDSWEPWLPPKNHPQHERLKLLQMQSLEVDYAEQKRLLDAVHDRTGEPIFVANYKIIEETQSRETLSFCAWSSGITSILPRTDKIALVHGEGAAPAVVSWGKAAEVFGDLMKPLGMYPERYRVDDFPTPSQIATATRY